MIIECPRCSTRYRLDEKRITRENPAFKCSRCGTVFLRFPEKAEAPSPPLALRRRSRSRQPAEADRTGTLPFITAPARESAAQFEPYDLGHELKTGSQPTEQPAQPAPATGADRPSGPPSAAQSVHIESFEDVSADILLPQRSSSFAALASAMAVIVFLYLCLALYLKGSHRRTEAFFAALPLVGDVLLEERALAYKVGLTNVRGSYEIIKDRQRVFAISGEAVNNAATPMNDIQVEGTITTKDGKISRKVVFCGNEARLTDLSAREIDLLHRLGPSYSLLPGQSRRFLIVFTDPPPLLQEFTTKVLSVRPAPSGEPPQPLPAARRSATAVGLASAQAKSPQAVFGQRQAGPNGALPSLVAERPRQG